MKIRTKQKARSLEGEAFDARVLAALPGTQAQIAEKIPEVHPKSIIKSIARMHFDGRIRIVGYVTGVRGPNPKIWDVSYGEEDAKPPRKSRKAKNCQAHRARQRQDGSYEDTLAKNRAKAATLHTCGTRDPLTAAFFGSAK